MSDVLVIGGGIVGLACAYDLTSAGASVTVLEYGKTGMQATNAAAGMIAPLSESNDPGPLLPFALRAHSEYPALAQQLEDQCGFDLELRLDGILKVAFDDAEAGPLQRRLAWQRELGLPVDWLDGATCRELEPKLSPRVIGGLFSASEGSVSNQMVALALERAAQARGAVIRNGTPVTGFTVRGGRIISVRSRDASYAADAILLAAGARSGQIATKLHVPLPVRPIRGQMIALGGMRPPIAHPVWGARGYLVPRANGLIFAGATVEDVGFRRRTTKRALDGLQAMSSMLVPQLRAAQQHFAWAGLRPGTPDDVPIIGPIPGIENAFAATGHFRSGILLGPLTGKLVARGITAGDWSDVPPEFSPARFA